MNCARLPAASRDNGLFRLVAALAPLQDVEHHHGHLGDPAITPYGNGVLLWFELDDFDAAVARAENLNAEIVMPRHRNPPNGNGGPNHWEVWLRDPDGYTVVLASPDGSADGTWRPAS